MTLEELKERAELIKQRRVQTEVMFHTLNGQLAENEELQKLLIEKQSQDTEHQ